MNIELIIDKEKLNFLTQNKIEIRKMNCEIKINNKKYNSFFNLYNIYFFDKGKYKVEKQKSIIDIKDFIELKILKQMQFENDILVDGKKYYFCLNEIGALDGETFIDIRLIEY